MCKLMWEKIIPKKITMLKTNLTKQNLQTVLAVGPRKFHKLILSEGLNKALGPGKKCEIDNVYSGL